MQFATEVKVDPEGHLYGSVSALDVMKILETQGVVVEKNQVVLPHAIKTLGEHTVQLKLKEGVVATVNVTVNGDHPVETAEVAAEETQVEDTEAPVETPEEEV